MTIEELYKEYRQSTGVSTDTRSVIGGQMFFALKGENFNGNKYARLALDKGASVAIIDQDFAFVDHRTILVDDVLTTLQDLASYHRKQFDIPVIGITGSNGKTTTKELLNSVLSTKFKVHYTKGNLNNHIGVPLTLLAMPEDTEIAIIEMGANALGEIKMLSEIASPTFGLITNVGKAHLEGFGGEEGVLQGKTELYRFVEANEGVLFVNEHEKKLFDVSKELNCKCIKYGISNYESSYAILNKRVVLTVNDEEYQSNLLGEYNSNNILSAIVVGLHFNVPSSYVKKAILSYDPVNNRSQLYKMDGYDVIMDAYNANPTSMRLAIDSFFQSYKGCLILGDMKELGKYSEIEHNLLLASLSSYTGLLKCILIGDSFFSLKSEFPQFHFFRSLKDSENRISDMLKVNGEAILVKGSRSMGLERLLPILFDLKQ